MKNLNLVYLIIFYYTIYICECAYEYSDINENYRFEDLSKDPVAFKKQVDCYLDRTPCEDVPQHYKTHIREEILHSCAQCDVKLKHNIKTFLQLLKTTLPEDYKLFRAKYDPDGTLFDRIEKLVSSF